MGLETFVGTFIDGLNTANPVGASDNLNQGDNHIRGIKLVLQNQFPNLSGAMNATHTELNYVVGVTSAIQTQLDAKNFVLLEKWDTTSGTSHANTSVPAGVTQIRVALTNVSQDGVAGLTLEIGDSSGYSTTSINGCTTYNTTGDSRLSNGRTDGIIELNRGSQDTYFFSGVIEFSLADAANDIWAVAGQTYSGQLNGRYSQIIGEVTLAGTLDRIRLSTTTGTDNFDTGAVSVYYQI